MKAQNKVWNLNVETKAPPNFALWKFSINIPSIIHGINYSTSYKEEI